MGLARSWRAVMVGFLLAGGGAAAAQQPTQLPADPGTPDQRSSVVQAQPSSNASRAVWLGQTSLATEAGVPLVEQVPCRRGLKSRWTRCKCYLQECFLGYTEEFEELPQGSSLHAHGQTMVANGANARLVLYEYDFFEGAAQLTHRGHHQLAKIAALLANTDGPVVIEPSMSPPHLARARRLAIINLLSQGPAPVPPDRVVIGPADAVGLKGTESLLIYRNLLLQTQNQPLFIGRTGGGTGGAGTGGGSGSQGGSGFGEGGSGSR